MTGMLAAVPLSGEDALRIIAVVFGPMVLTAIPYLCNTHSERAFRLFMVGLVWFVVTGLGVTAYLYTQYPF